VAGLPELFTGKATPVCPLEGVGFVGAVKQEPAQPKEGMVADQLVLPWQVAQGGAVASVFTDPATS